MSVPADSPRTLEAIKRRWHTNHDRGAHDYTDEGCRVLAEHAFADVAALVALAEALRRIADEDDPLWGIGSETEFARAALAVVPSGQPEGQETAT